MIQPTALLRRGIRRANARLVAALVALVFLVGPGALFSQTPPAATDERAVGRRWAVIVCVNDYVNRPRSFELNMFTKQGSPVVRVAVLDRYPNCDVTVNNRRLRSPRLTRKNRLYIARTGRGLSVQLNGEPVDPAQISEADLPGLRLALGNNRDEYGRVDTSKFPTV